MRMAGSAGSPTGSRLHDHICWPYDDAAAVRTELTRFLADGVSQGLRVAYAASGRPEELRGHLAGLHGVDALLAGGGLEIVALGEVRDGVPVDPAGLVDAYAAATERALGDGYRGYRVGADATQLVRTAGQQEALVRSEALLDRYAAGHPFSAMCAYDVRLGQQVLADLASLHPSAPATLSPFHLYSAAPGAVGLSGEVDAFTAPRFRRAFEHIRPALGATTVVYDLSAVTFLDHRALLEIEAAADAHGLCVLLRGAPRVVRRVVGLLDLRRVRLLPEERCP